MKTDDLCLTKAERKRIDAFLRKHGELQKKGYKVSAYGRHKIRSKVASSVIIALWLALGCTFSYGTQQYEGGLKDVNGNPVYYTNEPDGSVTTSYQQGGLDDARGNPTRYEQNTGGFNEGEE